ncbi:hypothetical protein G9A89_009917 [Geosiphon pyriformis]|nr:hypothetical protein G9A89_009917 [Geosiphon pyriformis]
MSSILDWEEKNKEKGKGREENIPEETTTAEEITSGWEKKYSREPIKEPPYIPLKYKDCGKKLFSLEAWVVSDEDYWMRTHYYCKPCHREQYDYPKRQGKWDNKPCLAYSKQLLNEGIWNDIPGREETCDISCQYMILISDWVSCKQDLVNGQCQSRRHFILEFKNNSLEPTDINLVPTKEEQEQHLEEINTQLCDHCLIPCDLIYNPPPRMIYMTSEK